MTTAQTIIERAFRETQIVPIDVAPTTAQINEALPLLQGIVERHVRAPIVTLWLGDLTNMRQQRGVILRDFTPYAPKVAAPQDIYLNCLLAEATTVMLPPSPGDGARFEVIDVAGTFGTYPLTLVGNGNLIDGGATLELNSSGEGVRLLYRRDIAQWVVLTPLGLSQNIPYPALYDDMFIIELAMRLDPRYGQSMSQITAQIYQGVRSMFVGRYQMVQSSASPDVLFDSWTYGNPWGLGNTGGY